MRKNFINNTFFLILGLFLFQALDAQSTRSVPLSYQLPAEAEIWEGHLIFKVKSQYRSACFAERIQLPSVEAALGGLKARKLSKIFPHQAPPATSYNHLGQELVDLSLIYSLEYDPQLFSINAAVSLLNRLPELEYVEPWFVNELFYQPNDFFADTTDGLPGMWHLGAIRAQEAWDIHRDDSTVILGIIDSGTSFLHPDMQDNLYLNLADPIDGIDNDQDGYIDNYRGWDFGGDSLGEAGDNDASTIAPWHGLGVAAVAAADTDNDGVGIAGTGFNCRYLPIKAAPESHIGGIYYGYQGLVYAVNQGCQVVNLSWGSPVRTRFGEDAVNFAAINKQAAVIVAAGNSNSDIRFYPAAFDRSISVAISGRQDSVCCSTTYNYSIDMSAPGEFIVSLFDNDAYLGLWQGTSISAPIVAGAVALTLGKYPQYTGVQAAQKVRVSAQSIPHASFQLDKVGKGRLDMFNAIIPDPTPSVRTNRYQLMDENGDGRISGGDTVILEASFLNYLDPTSDLEISVSVPVQQTPFVQVLSSQTSVGALGTLQAFQSGNAFKLAISQNLPVDYLLDLKFQYTDPQTGYDDFEYVQLRINPSWLNVEENQLHTTITSQGLIGFKDFFSFQEGIGLLYQNNRNILSEGGFLIATSANQVSNFLRTSNQNVRDNDFNIVDFVQKNPNPYLADFEASSTFADDIANQSIGMTVHQKTFAWSDPEYQRFVILLYEIENNNAVPISNLNAGLFTDFDIITQQLNLNRGNYDLAQRIIYTYDAQTGTNAHYGLKLLSEDNFYARALGDPGLSSFSDQAKFLSLTNTPTIPTASAALNGPGQDVMTYIGTGPINLMSGQKDTVAFALVVGDGLNDILSQSAAAQEAYDCILKGQGPISPFTIADPSASAGVPLQFQDNNPNATTWQWDFGDGTTASSANPQHTYSQHGRYTVSLKVSDGTCHFESQQSISVGFATDLEEVLPLDWVISPNPAREEIRIEGFAEGAGFAELQIYSLLGQQIWAYQWQQGAGAVQQSLALPTLAPGVYMLSIRSGERQQQQLLQIR